MGSMPLFPFQVTLYIYLHPSLELRRSLHPLPSKTSKILLPVHKPIARLPLSLVETPALIEIVCAVVTAKVNLEFLHIKLHCM
jgi:hypothetical protein